MPDQESIRGQLNLLDTLRKRLRIQINQQKTLGAHAPAYMQLEIDNAQEQIRKIKAYLLRNGVHVEHLAEDGEEKTSEIHTASGQAQPTNPVAASQLENDASDLADVFISYHPADKAWVRQTLLPLLEQQNGLRAIVDWRDFEIGVPKVMNVEKAVMGSRSTLIVLTPEWVQSEWNAFQELLASTTDPSGVQRKLLPVMLRACTPPPRIAMREIADLTEAFEQPTQLNRVVRSIKRAQSQGISSSETAYRGDSAPLLTTDFVIITALEEERDAVLAHLPGNQRIMPSAEDIRTYRFARVPVHFPDGSKGEYTVAVLSLISMGRVEASLATSDAIRRWSPRYVLMVGIAGGIGDEGVNVGDVLLSSQVIDYEVQKLTDEGESIRYSGHRADPRLLDAAQNMTQSEWRAEITIARPGDGQPRRLVGPVATGDKVVARKALLNKLRADWPKLIGIEMEAGGAAAAAFHSAQKPGFFMVRGVSDLADAHKNDDWREYACDVAAAYTIALLKRAPVPPR